MASKAGVIGFTRGLANDVAALGINVNAIGPALTKTPGTSEFPEEVMRDVWSHQAIQRQAIPDDIAGTALFLSSEDSAFVTGHTIMADGGMLKYVAARMPARD